MSLPMNRLALIYKDLLFATDLESIELDITSDGSRQLLHSLIGTAGIPTAMFVRSFNEAWKNCPTGRENPNTLLHNKETGEFYTALPTPMYFTLSKLGFMLAGMAEVAEFE